MPIPIRQNLRVGVHLFRQKLKGTQRFPFIVEIEPLFPGEAVLAIRAEGSLHSALQVFRSEPFDLVPYFMIALLFALALENLLANKFYRQSEAKEAVGLLHPPYGDPFRKFLSAAIAG